MGERWGHNRERLDPKTGDKVPAGVVGCLGRMEAVAVLVVFGRTEQSAGLVEVRSIRRVLVGCWHRMCRTGFLPDRVGSHQRRVDRSCLLSLAGRTRWRHSGCSLAVVEDNLAAACNFAVGCSREKAADRLGFDHSSHLEVGIDRRLDVRGIGCIGCTGQTLRVKVVELEKKRSKELVLGFALS